MREEQVARANDFTRFDENSELSLIRTDRNGTRYYETHVCPRCNGRGKLSQYQHVDNGVCYLCGGSGWVESRVIKVYTQDYYDKLMEKRVAKIKAHAEERNARFFEDFGLSDNGEAWIVLGNTYQIKDELKDAGARFKPFLGWYFNHKPEKYDCFKLSPETIVGTDVAYETQREINVEFISFSELTGEAIMTCQLHLVEQYIKGKQETYRAAHTNPGEYIGEIGMRITLPVTYKGHRSYETQGWGCRDNVQMFIEMFDDEAGNALVWKTTAGIFDLNPGDHINLTGTVKDHNEYNHIKQTLLSRCKVS